MTLILGIDDAGRGPVIGPMVLGGCLIEENLQEEFRKAGVKDSKQLTQKKREELSKLIKQKSVAYEILISYPEEIDNVINGKDGNISNINKLEAAKSAEIINKLVKNAKGEPVRIVIDCPSPNRKSWQDYLMEYLLKLNKNIKNILISCEHKADVNHIAVAAGSILAKCKREEEVAKIKKKIGKDFGSGYSSDPITRKFLEEHYNTFKEEGIFRHTWGTVKKHKSKKSQKSLGEF